MSYIVDFIGFKFGKNEVIVKEFAFIPFTNDPPKNYSCVIFEPPFDWSDMSVTDKIVNKFIERNNHGILWQDGTIPYSECFTFMRKQLQDAEKIFVVGTDRQILLQSILPKKKIVNLEMIRIPSLKTLPVDDNIICNHHAHKETFQCSLKHVVQLFNWLQIRYGLQNHVGVDEADAAEENLL